MRETFMILDEERAAVVEAAILGDSVRLSAVALKAGLGWELKAQGLCKSDRCIPLSAGGEMVTGDGIDLAAVTSVLARPLAIDTAERVAYVGASALERGAQLASLQAPDFTLPDLTGQQHSLSDYQGKKVLLVVYASW